MTLHTFGLNHDTAPVALREAFALDAVARAALLGRLALGPDAEALILSTCNRTEAVVWGEEADVALVRAALSDHAGTDWPEGHSFAFEDEEAVRHVLEVTAGLRSLVLGDAQILAQVKDAYRAADDAERVGPVLHRLLHAAFRAAKRVRTETALAQGAASVSSAAVAAARAHLGVRSLHSRRVLLVGAGAMGLAALRALAADRPAWLAVTNRHDARAAEVAALVGAVVVSWHERHEAVASADVVLVASGAPEPVLLAHALPPREGASSTLVVDVAVPRNVEPAVGALDGYTLLDLDHLQRAAGATGDARRAALPAARAICDEALADFVAWCFHQQALQPTVRALRATFDAIRRQELARYAHRFAPAEREAVDRLTRAMMQKLLAVPVVRLKAAGPEGLEFAAAVRALGRLFAREGCDDATTEETQAQSDAARFDGLLIEGACPHLDAPERALTDADRDAR